MVKLAHWTVLWSAIALAACHTAPHNKPELPLQKIYHAPAQIFDFDLSSNVLRGAVELKQSCNAMGTSLDIIDQQKQQVRIDTFNLHQNASLHLTTDSDLKTINEQLIALYQQKYQATATSSKLLKTSQGDAMFTRLTHDQQHLDIAIQSRYGYAYVITLNSPLVQDTQTAEQLLQTLLKSLYTPSSQSKGLDTSTTHCA